ncbi:MAG: FG-GAP-like repeat-containing protein [Nitrospiraceae bacterium]|nr:FG-GAP-like repeat-containing protein [Nitrospiraceae bacterium]
MATNMRGKTAVLLTSVVMTVIFLVPMQAQGATAPAVTRLLTIPDQSFAGKVISDSNGNIYVADIFYKTVRIYDSSGQFKKSIGLSYVPAAIALSPDNLLYVGEDAQDGHYYIDVYTLSGAKVRTMAATGPAAMAFLSTGELYLVDGYKVRKFNASMAQMMEFGGYTMFRDPSSIAVNEQKGELYILDMGGVGTEGSYTNTPVWRVQAFDLNGTLLRSFSSYGYGADGMVGSASAVAVDKDGRIYVSDNVQPIIAVFDENGAYLKTIFDTTNPLTNPANISYRNDRLYMASLAGNFVTAFGIDAYGLLEVTPPVIDTKWQSGMPAPAKLLSLSNKGTGPLTWQATVDAASSSWLSVSQVSGTLAANSAQDVTVAINTTGFTAGQTHTGSIDITSNGGSQAVAVKVTVADQPILTVNPSVITVTRKSNEKTNPMPLNITIGNDISGGLLTWHAAAVSDTGWLGMNPTEGTSGLASAPLVTFADAVAPGTYGGSITVTLEGAAGSPVTVPVTLEVVSANRIVVTTNTAEASFTVDGPDGATFSGTGESYTADSVAPGSYTITYKSVPGFKTPPSETKSIGIGEDATFVGTYTDLRQRMNIVASHGFRKNESNEVAIFKGDGTFVTSFVPALPYSYGVSTTVGDVDGDGVMDIVVGGAPSIVKGYKRDGSPISGLEFSAFETPRRSSVGGINLSTADFDGDGRDEIITGDAKNSSVVRVFSFGGTSVTDTGLYIEPFKDLGEGVNAVGADVDGDGSPELIVLQADSDVVPEVKIYKVNTAAGAGRWTADMSGRFKVCSRPVETGLAAADVDGDGVADIIVMCKGDRTSEVREFNGSGNLIASFTAAADAGSVAAGDTNFDAVAEIILGDAASTGGKMFNILKSQGSTLNTVPAFTKSYGVRVSVGNLGY